MISCHIIYNLLYHSNVELAFHIITEGKTTNKYNANIPQDKLSTTTDTGEEIFILNVLILDPILIEGDSLSIKIGTKIKTSIDEAWLSILFGIATTKIKAKKMGLGFFTF